MRGAGGVDAEGDCGVEFLGDGLWMNVCFAHTSGGHFLGCVDPLGYLLAEAVVWWGFPWLDGGWVGVAM